MLLQTVLSVIFRQNFMISAEHAQRHSCPPSESLIFFLFESFKHLFYVHKPSASCVVYLLYLFLNNELNLSILRIAHSLSMSTNGPTTMYVGLRSPGSALWSPCQGEHFFGMLACSPWLLQIINLSLLFCLLILTLYLRRQSPNCALLQLGFNSLTATTWVQFPCREPCHCGYHCRMLEFPQTTHLTSMGLL